MQNMCNIKNFIINENLTGNLMKHMCVYKIKSRFYVIFYAFLIIILIICFSDKPCAWFMIDNINVQIYGKWRTRNKNFTFCTFGKRKNIHSKHLEHQNL